MFGCLRQADPKVATMGIFAAIRFLFLQNSPRTVHNQLSDRNRISNKQISKFSLLISTFSPQCFHLKYAARNPDSKA